MKKIQDSKYLTRIIVQTGVLIAIALVIKSFSFMINIGGAPVLRISFSGPFSQMPGILFGPLIGGITKGIVDVIGFLIKPQGGFIPFFTLTAILGGVLTPLIWKSVKNINVRFLQKFLIVLLLFIGLLGITNHIILTTYEESQWAQTLLLLGKKTYFTTIILESASLIGLFLIFFEILLNKKSSNTYLNKYFLKLIIAVGIPGIIVTTLNTEILRMFIPGLSNKAFIVFWIPRLIEEIIMTIYISYVLSILLQIYDKLFKKEA